MCYRAMYWTIIQFQDSARPLAEELYYFHDYGLVIIRFITILVFYILIISLNKGIITSRFAERQILESVWTIIPSLILVYLAIPSLILLYAAEEPSTFKQPVKVHILGHQWYWSYEISWFKESSLDLALVEFDSYMETADFSMRLLEVDNRLVLPVNTLFNVLVRSTDVLHSWTIPKLGVKVDACPGRINQINLITQIAGLYFGQCSEICGANHRFIPIILEVIRGEDFYQWAISE